MITEDYVSFETAKLLKEKGFDLSEFYGKWAIDYDNIPHNENNTEGEIIITEWHYPLITQQMAMKWLREVHSIHIAVIVTYQHIPRKYEAHIMKLENVDDFILHQNVDFASYEQACETAIKYCLENLV